MRVNRAIPACNRDCCTPSQRRLGYWASARAHSSIAGRRERSICVRIGRRVLYSMSELQRWIEENQEGGTAQ